MIMKNNKLPVSQKQMKAFLKKSGFVVNNVLPKNIRVDKITETAYTRVVSVSDVLKLLRTIKKGKKQ